MKLVAGNSNRPLAEAISAYLNIPLAKCQVRRFADMEIYVEIQENVRGEDVFIIQSTSFPGQRPPDGAADHLRRPAPLLGTAHHGGHPLFRLCPAGPETRRADADFGQAGGQSHHPCGGRPRVLTLDLHAGQIQGFFDIPTDNLFSAPVMVRDIKERLVDGNQMVVSPDVGGVVRARALAKRIDAPLAIVDKRRERPGESEVMNIIGDVSGRSCILLDDIVDSGGTLVNAAEALLKNGAKEVYAYITHGVLSGGAVSRITNSKLKELVITDSIMPTEAVKVAHNIRVLPIAQLMGEAIGRTATESSVSSLFD